MTTIIHDPTRGWLLLTPDGQIEIAKEDLKDIVILGLWNEAEDHHPYSVDAKFEVKEDDPCKGGFYPVCADGCWGSKIGCVRKRQIARLVKACVLDYYQIRAGQCKHGETGGPNGEILCRVCNNGADRKWSKHNAPRPTEAQRQNTPGGLVKAKVGTDEERGMVNLTHVIVDEDRSKQNPTESITSDKAELFQQYLLKIKEVCTAENYSFGYHATAVRATIALVDEALARV